MSTKAQKRTTGSAVEIARPNPANVTVHLPLTVENLRGEIWRTIQDARSGVISIVNAAVIARLAHELMKTYRVMPDVDEDEMAEAA